MNSDVPPIESARANFQASFDAGKPPAERNLLGQFATPYLLAKQITDYAISITAPSEPIRFFDPAIGSGAFYTALITSLRGRPLAWAKGYEIDPQLAEFSRLNYHDQPLTVVEADFTTASPPTDRADLANLIICNPPYVRHHHLAQDAKVHLKRAVLDQTGHSLNGLAGLYCYFLLLSRAWMDSDALAGWLIPTEFMDVSYGRQVRSFLAASVDLIRIHRFAPTDLQFSDALVSSSVVWFRNRSPSKDSNVIFSFGPSLLQPSHSQSVSRAALLESSKWTSFASASPRPTGSRIPHLRLRDIFHIKRGIATGANSFFILDDAKIEQLLLPRSLFRPILPSPRAVPEGIILADADGAPMLRKRLFVLNCDLPEAAVKENYPSLWDYLQEGVRLGINNRYLCRSRNPWYAQEKRPPAPILCSYMGRAKRTGKPTFRFFLNRSLATAPNVYLMLYPHLNTANPPSLLEAAIEAIWRRLDQLTDEHLLPEGRVYGGGLYKLEPAELGNLPADFAADDLATSLLQHSQLPLDLPA